MRVDPRRRIKEIASASEAAERVLESCGVDYCCKGDVTLLEACARAGLDARDVEKQLRELPDPEPHHWEDTVELLDHIVGVCHPRTHHALARARAAAHGTAVRETLDELAELATAQMKEEASLFRHVRALAAARAARGPFPDPPFTTIRTHGRKLRERHAKIHDLLRHARALARAPSVDSPALRHAMDALAHALVAQMHLENNELLPRARALEPE